MEIESNLDQKALQKKIQFEELYHAQQIERDQQKIKKQLNEQLYQDPKEQMLQVQKTFRSNYDQLLEQIKSCTDNSKLDLLFQDHNNLNNYFIETNHALFSYDRQQYREMIESLEKKILLLKEKLNPRQKFKFTKRIYQNKSIVKEIKSEQKNSYIDEIPGICSRTDQTIEQGGSETHMTYKITDNNGCTINLFSMFDTVYIKNNQNCNINIGPVKSSVFIDNCKNCTFNIMAHQIRIHNTQSTTFKIFASSKSIIETSSDLTFCKYDFKHYDAFDQDFQNSGLALKEDLWDQVQDFNWLKQEKSPNFTIIQ